MKRNVLGIITFICMAVCAQIACYADTTAFVQHYEAAKNYMNQGQYSSAIVEYRKALSINYMDNSARIGLINSYLARGAYWANQENNYDKAANDFRSALCYLKIFPSKDQAIQNAASMIASTNENLNQCLKVTSFDKTPSARYKKAEELRATGNLSAAAYEFSKAAENSNLAANAYVQIGELLKILRNEPRAADYFKMALDLNPTDGVLRMKYARTLDKLGRYDDALPQFNAALANSKGDMEVLYSLERIYKKKLAETPSDAELNANIGAIKQAQGDFESALTYYAKAEQLNPDNITTRLNVGTLYQQKKDYSRALKSYDSVLTLYPDNVQANLYKAQVLNEMGRKNEALELYKKVLSIEPSNQTAKSEIVSVMQDTMSPREFIAYLGKNSQNDRAMQNILYDYAYKMHKEGKTQDAIYAYTTYISANQSNVDAYVNLAICYAAGNDYDNAVKVLNSAKEKFPSNNLVLKTLSNVNLDSASNAITKASEYFENKDYKKALDLYLSVNPATEDSLLGAAAAYQAMENYNLAISYYKKAEKINPKNSQIPYYIGYLYSELQNWKDAELYLKKAVSLNPNSEAKNLLSYVSQNMSASQLNEGIEFYEKKNTEAALTKFNDILRQDAGNAYAYYYRGLIYDDQKKPQLAINDYLNVLKYTKDLPIANYMLGVDYDGLGKYNEAYKYYNQFISSYTTEDEYLQYAKDRTKELKPYVGG